MGTCLQLLAADAGLTVRIDLESEMVATAAQARYLGVLLDELEAAGVTRAYVRPRLGD